MTPVQHRHSNDDMSAVACMCGMHAEYMYDHQQSAGALIV